MASSGSVAFLLGLAATKDLRNILCAAKKSITIKRNRLEGVKKLYQFIEFHSTVKELSLEINYFSFIVLKFNLSFHFFLIRTIGDFMDVFHWVTIIVFLWCLGTLCVALILLEMGIVK